MSAPICLRCLSRSLHSFDRAVPTAVTSQRAAFSTTSPSYATPPKKKTPNPGAPRGGGTLRLRKNVRAAPSGKPPAPGERKAIRKRVVLSNTNALEVRGLLDFTKRNSTSIELKTLQNCVLGLANETLDALRALGCFKPTQGWSFFRRPATVVRGQTIALAGELDKIEKSAKSGTGAVEQSRTVLFGEKGSGKSVLQLQALAMAHARGWIVVHIPEAQDMVIGHTAYEPTTDQDGNIIYIQPHYTAELLSNVSKANSQVLDSMRISMKHKFPVPLQENISLLRLLELGASDPAIAFPVWQAFLKEMTTASQEGQGLQRPPVFFALDGLDYIMRPSAYLDRKVKPIHSHDLALTASLIDLLNGKTSMNNGGMIVACTTGSNKPSTPSLDHVLAEKYAASQSAAPPRWEPYEPLDERVSKALDGVKLHKIGGLSKEETKGVMEYYALSGVLRDSVSDRLIGEKWVVSGGGIIGELEKGCILRRF